MISGTSILLVEDNPGDSRLIQEMLADVAGSKADVMVAETLADGLHRAQAGTFDAMLLDLSLPDSTGLDTLRAVKEATPAVPIIVLTGTEDDELASAALREGAQDYLVKGRVDGELIARAIRYAIERKRSERQLEEYNSRLESLVAERTAELTRVNNRLVGATEAKSRFLASMSHELRTPLNSIIGFTVVMLQGLTGEITDEQRSQLTMVRRSGERLLALINDMLDLSRIESGRVAVQVSDVVLADLVASSEGTVRPMARERGVALVVGEVQVGVTIRTDEGKVHQMLVNLLSNAVKFTDEGSVTLTVTLPGADVVQFEVADTGVGIASEDLAAIFDEFVQVPHDGAKPEGTGLGLSISRRLALMLGGSLTASSVVGKGSTFTLRVPLVYAGRSSVAG